MTIWSWGKAEKIKFFGLMPDLAAPGGCSRSFGAAISVGCNAALPVIDQQPPQGSPIS
jgi:hypothetical protein